jgi:hypothetical protein
MKIVFRTFEDTIGIHVRVESVDPNGTLAEFESEIKKKYPDSTKYFWRHRPSREEHRDFERDDVTVKFYARFSVPKKAAHPGVGDVTSARAGGSGGED